MELMTSVFITSLAAALILLASLIWSIAWPEKRLWPPRRPGLGIKIFVWLLTLTFFAGAIYLGLGDWNSLGWPASMRWGLGLPLIVLGNLIVWYAVAGIGIKATSGDVAELKTDGLYRWSRNPQYVADMGIFIGWAVLSASPWVLALTLVVLILAATAPFAEEPWLSDTYGEEYNLYKQKVRRYL